MVSPTCTARPRDAAMDLVAFTFALSSFTRSSAVIQWGVASSASAASAASITETGCTVRTEDRTG